VYLGLPNEREWKKFVMWFCRLRSFPQTLALTPCQGEFRIVNSSIKPCKMFSRTDRSRNHSAARTAQIANARMNTVQEFVDHPQLKPECAGERGFARRQVATLLPPVTMEHVDTAMNEIPALGQHTDAILGELGFDSETIAGCGNPL